MAIRRSKLLIAAATAASALAVVPATPAASAVITPCRVAPLVVFADGAQFVAITGAYTAAGTNVVLTCHAVVDGTVYTSVTEDLPGPVAVVAGTAWLHGGELSACYTLRIDHLTGSDYLSDCP